MILESLLAKVHLSHWKFMIPLKDDNPVRITPLVTWALILVNVLVFFYQLSLDPRQEQVFVYQYGSIPAVVLGYKALPAMLAAIPPKLSLFTSMFLHGGWLHLIGNMWYLWIFGDNLEAAMGKLRYLIFYLACGVLASISHSYSNPTSVIPTIGASGAISGVLGGYLLLYPRARVLVLIPLGFFIRIMQIPAGFVLGFWFVLQLLSGSLAGAQQGGGVAFWAHIGGFIAGMILVGLFKKREVRFFNPAQERSRFYE
jgi:membrane associated rhomboid family serine protease